MATRSRPRFALRAFGPIVTAVLVLSSAAGFDPRAADVGTRTVEVVGEAAVVGGDLDAARRRARIDARVRAVERAAGVMLESESVVLDELLAASSLRTRAVGSILDEEVVSSGVEGDGMYRIRLRARVSEDRLVDSLIRLVESDRVALIATVRGHVVPGSRDAVVRSSTAALSLQGFRRVEPVDDPEPDGLGAARRVGLRHRAQAVLSIDLRTGEARDEGGGLWSATASAAVTLYRIDGDDERVHDAVHEVRGFAETREDAVLAAIEAACERSWTRLADRVLPAEYREVRVEVLDIPEFAEFERVQELLAAQGWVEDVRVDPVGYHPRKTVFFVRGRQDAVLLGASLDRWPELEVVQAGTGGLLVRFVR